MALRGLHPSPGLPSGHVARGQGCPKASGPYLVQLGEDGAGSLLLLVLLHLGLQALVVLQGLLAALHCHVQAGEHAAEPAGEKRTGGV